MAAIVKALPGEISECSSMSESFIIDNGAQRSSESSDREGTFNPMVESTDRGSSDFDENSDEEDEEKDFDHGVFVFAVFIITAGGTLGEPKF